jgi:anaerobic selenocysteine-containing dehydrogenase
MYLEKNTGVKHSGTGKAISPIAIYVEPYTGLDGKAIDDSPKGYDLKLITYREIAQIKSRTQGNYWLKALLPENFLLMNSADAAQRGLRDGDQVHISCASNPNGEWNFGEIGKRRIEGKLKVVEGMRPGVVSFALGFGHWAYGAVDISIDGMTIKGDEQRYLRRLPRQRCHAHRPDCPQHLPGRPGWRFGRVLRYPGQGGEGVASYQRTVSRGGWSANRFIPLIARK